MQGSSAPCSDQGLTEAEAHQRLMEQGPNELPASRPHGVSRLLRQIVSEPIFLLLVACGTIYMLLGDRHEALMLLGFVLVVMGISFVQQRRTEQSLEALRDLSSPRALIVREGQTRRIAGSELVSDDIVLLAEGDRIPADMHVLASSNLAVDESLLTGESAPVPKQAGEMMVATAPGPGGNDIARVFSGTLVIRGTARCRVVATGERSALGRIGKSLESIGREETTLQLETRRIVKRIAFVGLALAGALAIAYRLSTGDWLQGLLAGLTLAMAILPEELPVILTLFLGLGAWRLARERVLTRSIPAVELLGATTVLCVDKTGTLTANRMAVRRIWTGVATFDGAGDAAKPLEEALHPVLEFAVLASHRRAFDPMEAAIGAAGLHLLADTEHLHADWTLIDDYPLSNEMMAMSRVWRSPDRRERLIAAKGAPEAIVDLCHLDAAQRAEIVDKVSAMASDGLRVLGVASAIFHAEDLPGNQHDFEFAFLGLIALEDPVRPEVPGAIAECLAAGMRVVMMTGDHPITAVSVARQVGLPADSAVITGSELAALSDDALRARLADTNIFCRVQPEQKLRLVQALRACGEVVAMTGDGVNDAPALKAAHIGVAMGARGTDVAREAASLVLLNDDFASLVTAVRYGRRVFANLRKAIVFVIAAHIPIIGLSLVPVMLGWPILLMPVHILFLQLIIDPACSVVFEAEPLEPGAMTAPPRSPSQRLFGTDVLTRGVWQGVGLLMLLLVVYASVRSMQHSDDMARAVTFMALVLSNLGLIRTNRSWSRSSWHGAAAPNRQFGWIALATLALLGCVLGIPEVSQLFAFTQPTVPLFLAGAGMAVVSLLWFQAVKWGFNRRRNGRGPAPERAGGRGPGG